MKIKLIISMMFAALFVAGCSTPGDRSGSASVTKLGSSGVKIEGKMGPYGNLYGLSDEIESNLWGQKFALRDVRGFNTNGIKTVQATLENKQKKHIDLEYKYAWFDNQGVELFPNLQVWQHSQLAGRESKVISDSSKSDNATGFRILVREFKNMKN